MADDMSGVFLEHVNERLTREAKQFLARLLQPAPQPPAFQKDKTQ